MLFISFEFCKYTTVDYAEGLKILSGPNNKMQFSEWLIILFKWKLGTIRHINNLIVTIWYFNTHFISCKTLIARIFFCVLYWYSFVWVLNQYRCFLRFSTFCINIFYIVKHFSTVQIVICGYFMVYSRQRFFSRFLCHIILFF